MDCVFLRHSVKSSYEKASLPWMAPLAFHNTGRCLQEESLPWNSRHSEQLERMWSGHASGFGKMPKVQANCWTHKQRNHRTGRFIYSYVKPSAQVQKSELNPTDNYLVSAPTHSTKWNLPPLLQFFCNWLHCQIQTEHCLERRNWSATSHQKVPSIGWLLTFASKPELLSLN